MDSAKSYNLSQWFGDKFLEHKIIQPPDQCSRQECKTENSADYDVPLRHRGDSGEPWATGMIGCLDQVHGESLQSMDEDYAERTCTKIMDMIDKFATPWGRNPEMKRCTISSVLPLAALSSTEPS